MRTVQEIRTALQGYRPEEVAAGTGLSYNTVRRYANEVVANPRLTTVRLLSDWLAQQEEPAAAVR